MLEHCPSGETSPGWLCWAFFLVDLQKPAQGLHNEVGVDRFASGYKIRVDHAASVKIGQDHLFLPASMDPGLDGPRLALFYPLF